MSELISTLRAIIRDELARVRPPGLGIVTEVFSRDGDDSANHHQVNVRLRASGVELARVPVAVPRIGLSALPAVGDLVLLSFVDGELNTPVVVGALYHDEADPPVGEPAEIVYQPPESAESGVRRLHVELANGGTITVEDEVVRIELGGTTVEVNHDGDIALNAAGNLSLTAGGDIEIKADGKVDIQAQADLTAKGNGQATIEGAASATLKGPQVKLAGMTSFSPS